MEPGKIIFRYGYPGGTYTSPVGTPYSMCALPVANNNKDYTVYELLKPMTNVQKSKIAPWFGEIGLGTQYKLCQSVRKYVDSGHLKEIKK
ncbi:TNT domain-containing protein [Candidatus Pantoea soli]|uniref:TNT domain-containing protein n=1 Tax=Candidatus Pantoea soli TaxID=3098669 RepID=UPI001644ABB8